MALEIEKKFKNFNNNTIRDKFGDLNIIKNGNILLLYIITIYYNL